MKQPSKLKQFFAPSSKAPFALVIAPYAVLVVLLLGAAAGVTAAWDYTNSISFCGTSCHTMPPQYATFLRSPHSRVTCSECHLGRESFPVLLGRKVEHSSTVTAMIFKTYEYPIVAKKMRPANEACETCHFPGLFTADSLKEVRKHLNDEANTPTSTFLLLKTGGGLKRDGLGKGIHWHIQNKVTFYATDELEQNIPYVRVEYDDGTVKEFVDIESKASPQTFSGEKLKQVDCITCHNRITHDIASPTRLADAALYSGELSGDLPYIRQKAVDLLSGSYASLTKANAAFESLAADYQASYPEVYQDKQALITRAVSYLKSAYAQTHYEDQELNWTSHPNNTGHTESPGCFRCHDGKHIAASGETIRLECNLCHSVPENADPSQFVSEVSIVRGAQPGSHTSSWWIAVHGKAVDSTCARCHAPKDPAQDWTQLNGQKPPADGSFCGNSACHQSEWTYAGFDSPALQPLLEQQLEQAKRMNQAPAP